MAIGSLAVRVSANTSQYNQGMRSTKGPANNMRRQMADISKRAAKMTVAMAAAGAAIAAHMTRRGLQAVDAQAKLARQLGSTQAEVAGMTRAAKDAGIEQGQLESNLQALNKRLGEAQEGSGRAADTLDKLGLSAQELAEMPMAERMDAIGSAINGLSTQTEKAAATADLFSRSGLDMMNVFAQGEGAVQKATDEAVKFGTAVTEVDSARIEAANDAMDRISDVFQGVSNQLASELAPILQGVAKLFTDSASEAGGFRDQIKGAIDTAIAGAQAIGKAWRGVEVVIAGGRVAVARIIQAFFELRLAVNNALAASTGAVSDFENMLRGLASTLPGMEFQKIKWEPFADSRDSIQRDIEFAKDNTENFTEEMADLIDRDYPLSGLDDWVEGVRERTKEAAEASKANTDNMVDPSLVESFNELQDAMTEKEQEELANRLDALREDQATREELLIAKHERDLELLRVALENEMITEQEFRERKEHAEAEHMGKMASIREEGMNEMAKIGKMFWEGEIAQATGALANITTGIANHSRKAFKVNKAAALANAIVGGYQAAVSAWKAGMETGGPAAPAVAAAYTAASLAKTGAEISNIRSQSFGGGGGGAASQANTPSTPVHHGGGQAGGGQGGGNGGGGEGGQGGNNFNITLHGDSFSGEGVVGLIDELNDAVGDGHQLNARMG